MGKSPEKLRLLILVDEEWGDHEKVQELRDKGHQVDVLDTQPHLILSKSAHMWADDLWPLLDITLKAARKRKKGQSGESEDE